MARTARADGIAMGAGLLVILLALVLGAAGMVPHGVHIDWFDSLPLWLGLFWLVVSVLWTLLETSRSTGRSAFHSESLKAAAATHFKSDRVIPYLGYGLLLTPFMSAFVALKRAIPDWRPFSWDAWFTDADVLLHGGRLPSDWLIGMDAFPLIVTALDRVYYLWFPVVLLTVTWWAWNAAAPVRARFFLTYFATWSVHGVGLATWLSSAGPCYYQHVVPGANPYEPLMERLAEVSAGSELLALEVQDYLWTGFATNAYPIEGISAMPSMHVAMAALFLFASRGRHWTFGAAYLAFLVLILVGSVALGWHYAVDGYASILGTWLLWTIAGRTATRRER